jgi:hypothetical protein
VREDAEVGVTMYGRRYRRSVLPSLVSTIISIRSVGRYSIPTDISGEGQLVVVAVNYKNRVVEGHLDRKVSVNSLSVLVISERLGYEREPVKALRYAVALDDLAVPVYRMERRNNSTRVIERNIRIDL